MSAYPAASTGRTTYRSHFTGPLFHALDPDELVETTAGPRTGTTLCGLRGLRDRGRAFDPEAPRACRACRQAIARRAR